MRGAILSRMSSPAPTITYTFRYFRGDTFVSLNNIKAASDVEAVRLAVDALFGFNVEVWEDGRFVQGMDGAVTRLTPRLRA